MQVDHSQGEMIFYNGSEINKAQIRSCRAKM